MGKKIPFSLDRNDSRSLARQVADGFRKAIVDGYYLPGDVLPSVRELAPMLGVSVIVTSAAIKQLGEEGFVMPRPKIGTIVRNRATRQWRGHVVLVQPEDGAMYSRSVIALQLRKTLLDAGYLLTLTNVSRGADGRCDFGQLDALLSRSTDLVVAHHERPATFAHLAKLGVPFAVVADMKKPPKGAVGLTRLDYGAAKPLFATRCVELGVKKVIVVHWGGSSVSPELTHKAIRCEKIALEADLSHGRLEGLRRAGFDVFSRLIAENRIDRKAVYFIADDYVASGALVALSCAGLKSPEDVRLVTWSNTGISNVYPRELSRMEMDSAEAGRQIAASTLEYLKNGAYPSGSVGPKWIDGETMGEFTSAAGTTSGSQRVFVAASPT